MSQFFFRADFLVGIYWKIVDEMFDVADADLLKVADADDERDVGLQMHAGGHLRFFCWSFIFSWEPR